MKSITTKLLFAGTLISLPFLAAAIETLPNQEIQQARSLVKSFGSDLKQVLKTAMQTEGPLKALEVCNLQAKPIADKNSSVSPWNIGRTSLRVRNENNIADEWETSVLQQFEKRKKAGEDLKNMEYSEIIKSGDKSVYRYMKPIPTAGLCLTCHGTKLSNDVHDKVKALYPEDKAIGFNVGDIRGAFTLIKTLNVE
ncbi:Tll0287-like domain-containing protein [Pseudocolwellia agarivorans]|uniref:Tll0287-like domain-containing protein n=1 Tax=Pseudocolwellia agarivorans TaxID=1911682 RepID=UPI00098750A1|nr:DUF3365 domain-containing protein [Pseudocolwellia agarivorans]